MSTDRLTALLAAGATAAPERSPDCPDEHQIAGYVDGGLDSAAREQVQLHLADCAGCLQLVGMLCRERDSTIVEPVAPDLLEKSRAAATRPAGRAWWLAPQWAAAAAIVLAVPLLVQVGRNLDRGTEGQGRPEPAVTRSFAAKANGLQVLVPGAGSLVDVDGLSFRWTEMPGSPYYDVRIVTDDGDVVVRERVTGTTWQPPARVRLQPGAEYFVHVDAYPSGDKAVSSDHVPFRVSD